MNLNKQRRGLEGVLMMAKCERESERERILTQHLEYMCHTCE